ncbi:hypothetical protein IOQ59_08565 [Pontibacterium sp. N1Y112]|uniref:Uncharacterized protein n=1 Tax=Pontibacterium sinense TaxID=2781979 RepID=A0A8J7FCS4_9GAMM|nr:hypothetical protein [Pontibacterium sinense]MBE9397311.1 hypothetical protein [Pontibacterium sinense]MCO4757274.1 hypothetical protein [Oceanospirillaceae bacterium]
MRYLLLSAALLISGPVLADCGMKQTFCESKCKVTHLGDDAAATGCKSKCIAQRAACSTEKGAETVIEVGKKGAETAVDASQKAWENTKSFIKGATE